MVNVLAIGAHPDDIEVGCGGTAALHKRHGDKVYFLVLTLGEVSGDPKLKRGLCEKSARLLGVDGLFFGGLSDTMVPNGVETIQVIEKIVADVNPDVVYTHTFKDDHQDHRSAAYATLSAAKHVKKVFMYETPSNTLRGFCPKFFVDISESFDLKKKSLKFYTNEFENFMRVINALESLAVFRGFQARVGFAEAFELGRFVKQF